MTATNLILVKSKKNNMPNWCNNDIQILGKKKELEKIKKKIKKKNFLNSFIKLPKELKETQSPPNNKKNINLILKYGADNWYDWNIKNWGIKWDFELLYLDDGNESEITFSFDTPWRPPIEGFEKISSKYPELVFFLTYDEPGMRFKGIAKIQNGSTDNKYFDYNY